jgi:hypothetical protein
VSFLVGFVMSGLRTRENVQECDRMQSGPWPLAGQCIVQLESSVVDWNFFKGIGEDSPLDVFLFP